MLRNHLGFSIHLCNFIHRISATNMTGQIMRSRMNKTDGWEGRAMRRQVRIRLTRHSWRWSLCQAIVWYSLHIMRCPRMVFSVMPLPADNNPVGHGYCGVR